MKKIRHKGYTNVTNNNYNDNYDQIITKKVYNNITYLTKSVLRKNQMLRK